MLGNETRKKAIELRLSGLTYEEIGNSLGFSRQYAQQLVRPVTSIYRAVKQTAKGRSQKCGLAIRNGHIHHIKSEEVAKEDFNNLENLEYVCISCHRELHNERANADYLCCSKCGEMKPRVEFYQSGPRNPDSLCKPCRKEYGKEFNRRKKAAIDGKEK